MTALEIYPIVAMAIRLMVGLIKRTTSISPRLRAPLAVALGAVVAAVDILATGRPWPEAVAGGLAAASAAIASHELGEAASGKRGSSE